MVEAVAEMDDELTHKYLEGDELTEAEIKRGLRLGTLQYRIVPGPRRLRAQEQGRPADARRGRGLPARRRSTSRRSSASDPRRDAEVLADRRRRASRSAPSPSRSRPTRSSASWPSSGSTRARSSPARTCSTPRRARRSGSAASSRCTPTTARRSTSVYAGDIAAAVGLKDTVHRRHADATRSTRSSSSR